MDFKEQYSALQPSLIWFIINLPLTERYKDYKIIYWFSYTVIIQYNNLFDLIY